MALLRYTRACLSRPSLCASRPTASLQHLYTVSHQSTLTAPHQAPSRWPCSSTRAHTGDGPVCVQADPLRLYTVSHYQNTLTVLHQVLSRWPCSSTHAHASAAPLFVRATPSDHIQKQGPVHRAFEWKKISYMVKIIWN